MRRGAPTDIQVGDGLAIVQPLGPARVRRVALTQNATAVFRSPEMIEGETYSAGPLQPARGRFWPWAAFGEGPGGLLSLVVTPAECGDGMSDRDYGLSTTLILRRPGQAPEFYEGCCSLGQ